MKVIVGLGNPGSNYTKTRHNIGFMVVDAFAKEHQLTFSASKFKADIVKTKLFNEDILLVKPTTYMNLSGESLQLIKQFYQLTNDDFFIIYDDLDLETGKLRLRKTGSAGGQNGMKNILNIFKSQVIKRLRIGIDKDHYIPIVDYVLGKFTPTQQPLIDDSIKQAVQLLNDYIKYDFDYVMNKYNKK